MLGNFCQEFRDQLIEDFGLTGSNLCPKCCITYIDGWCDEACRYEPIGDYSSKDDSDDEEPPMALVCIFDYENTPLKEVVLLWLDRVIERCEEDEVLIEKWRGLIAKKLETMESGKDE